MIAWAWDSVAAGVSGCGISDKEDRALAAAAGWMLEHQARTATAVKVAIDFDAVNPAYVPDGRPARATVDAAGRVRWRRARR